MPQSLNTWIRHSRQRLAPVCHSPAQLKAELAWILQRVAGISAEQALKAPDQRLDEQTLVRLETVLRRRIEDREPLQYILGEAPFFDLHLGVAPGVLIPRPETELLVEAALDWLRGHKKSEPRVLDVGTGSGAIALAVARFSPSCDVVATDISEAALVIARQNAERYPDLAVDFRQGDLLAALEAGETFDLILSNPPYIEEGEWAALAPEVRDHEPKGALVAAEAGQAFYRRLATDGQQHLRPGGAILVELGDNRAEGARQAFEAAGFEVAITDDYTGTPRVLKAVKPA